MLTQLRQQSQSFLIYILFGILIVVFIFFFGPQAEGWQPGQATRDPSQWAARAGTQEATGQEVTLWMLRQERYGLLDDDALSNPGVRREAATQILEQLMLEDRARGAGLRASESEVTEYITSKQNTDLPLFSDRSGTFTYERFQSGVSQGLGASPATYRRAKGRELVVNRYIDFLNAQVKVSDKAVRAAWDRAKRTWNLEYVKIDPADYADQAGTPTAEEGEAYAKANADEVAKYYEANKRTYDNEKEVRVSRLLLRVKKDGGDTAKADTRKALEALRVKATAEGADFEAIVKESSEGAFKDAGGDMGWQVKGNADYAFFAALEKGTVSEIKESPFGLWFVRATDVKPAVKRSLDEVRGEIGAILAGTGKRKAAARKVADEMLAQLKAGKPFAEVAPPLAPATPDAPDDEGEKKDDGEAKADGEETAAVDEEPPPAPEPQVKVTGAFNEDRPAWKEIPGIGESEALARQLPTLTAEKPLVDSVLEVGDALYVVKLRERKEPDAANFAEEKKLYETRLSRGLSEQFFGRWRDTVYGPTRGRALQARFGGRSGALLASLPAPGTSSTARLNDKAYPPAAPAPAKSAGAPVKLTPTN